ncbi:thiamine diphosphokinase [Staphylococcus sp. 17KM0847]|uniref:thiamine diphosphokinase n=1 Tax=Staphylococcus sp. 17KM0847 TaxID=2583989 RepID=UPI0015DD4207|nr:thiamine diphosphokinase [Staphylococcus sp. 17KM0847]QLK85836.1 thiamine diphosphokinase [Staphylococcus sp. 17KM0847]
MSVQKIHLLCSERHLPEQVFEKYHDAVWAGVDRGTLILLEHDIQPVFAVGDFDSVSEAAREWIANKMPIDPVPAEKADTDLALAIEQAIDRGYQDICIYGATGGRLDHFMGAMQLLKTPAYQTHHVKLIDCQNEITLLTAGEHQMNHDKQYTYISFMPASDEVVISLTGFKYNLERKVLSTGTTLTVSNEFVQQTGHIHIHKGMVYQMRSRDYI